MAGSSLYPRGKRVTTSVTLGSANNPVVSVQVSNNQVYYTLADGTRINAGVVASSTSTSTSGGALTASQQKAHMIAYSIILGED